MCITILFHFIDYSCRELNEHVNKLRGTTSKNVEGWTIDVDYGPKQIDVESNHIYWKCQDDNSWYGYGFDHGSIKTTLNGCGKARLDFGNCNPSPSSAYVQVLLNGNEIGKATSNELSKKIEFDFNDGDILELAESPDDLAIIKFNNFTVVGCC